ncbi:MAG: hypothetical protein L0G80_18005, partial [Shewanella sp.]|uniref:hypothetical protein n=1 Tax=Shewanella sp. TaxID=50422 RepID=UPI002648F119
ICSFFGLKSLVLLFLLLLTQSKAGIFLLFLYYAVKYISSFSFKGLLVLIISSFLIYYAVTFFELEYYLKFVNNLEHYAFKSKRAQEILYFLSSSWTEVFFGKFILDGMYFESEIFSSLNRNGILGSFWLIAIFAGFSFLFLVLKSKKEKELILFLIVFVLFYCVISAGFSRSKIGIFYIFIIAIFTVRNRACCNRGDSCIV